MKHNKLRKTDYLVYKNIPCCNMSEKEIIDTSNLFSEYGLHIVQTVPSVMKE